MYVYIYIYTYNMYIGITRTDRKSAVIMRVPPQLSCPCPKKFYKLPAVPISSTCLLDKLTV